jgi:hypothetical protein
MSGGVVPAQQAATELADLLRQARFPLTSGHVANAPAAAAALTQQIEQYVLPRLAALDAPLLAVVGGSTGAGKSTLVNSLVGRQVSPSGVLRPTTRHPVLVHHPDDTDWFAGSGVLPGLDRVPSTDAASGAALRLVADEAVPAGIALLDAPDVDSVVVENRLLAAQLLAAADLWLFVTSAARYADAVPWTLLRDAVRRQAAVAVLLDRVPPEAVHEVAPDLAKLMASESLGDAPLLVVLESTLHDGLLPAEAVSGVRSWLEALAADAAAREVVVRSTLTGALHDLGERSRQVAAACDDQQARVADLREATRAAYAEAGESVLASVEDGTLLRDEVLSRWRDLAGAADISATIESWMGRVRGRFGWRRPSAPEVAGVERAITSGLRDVLADAADRAAARTAESWRAREADALLAPGLDRPSPDLSARSAAGLHAWRDGVLDLVRTEGGARKTTARGVAAGINGVAVVLIVATFASTGGVTGAELGIAAAAALASQRALESVFGSRAVSRLTDQVRADLRRRVDEVLAAEAARFTSRLDDAGVVPGLGDRLRAAADRLDRARLAVES